MEATYISEALQVTVALQYEFMMSHTLLEGECNREIEFSTGDRLGTRQSTALRRAITLHIRSQHF
jgi:hypothetical protein